jgi:hypothetical protein
MSFEGYSQLVCKKRHVTLKDAYSNQTERCICGADIVFSNLVDDTNGEEAGKINFPVTVIEGVLEEMPVNVTVVNGDIFHKLTSISKNELREMFPFNKEN